MKWRDPFAVTTFLWLQTFFLQSRGIQRVDDPVSPQGASRSCKRQFSVDQKMPILCTQHLSLQWRVYVSTTGLNLSLGRLITSLSLCKWSQYTFSQLYSPTIFFLLLYLFFLMVSSNSIDWVASNFLARCPAIEFHSTLLCPLFHNRPCMRFLVAMLLAFHTYTCTPATLLMGFVFFCSWVVNIAVLIYIDSYEFIYSHLYTIQSAFSITWM